MGARLDDDADAPSRKRRAKVTLGLSALTPEPTSSSFWFVGKDGGVKDEERVTKGLAFSYLR